MPSATAIRLTLPFPPRQLSPNARPKHWSEKARAVRQYREDCGWTAVEAHTNAGRPVAVLKPPVRATVTFVVPNRHKRDTDNLLAMLKPAWDGLVDAGVLEGDDSERFSVEKADVTVISEETRRWVPDAWSKPHVIVELRGA